LEDELVNLSLANAVQKVLHVVCFSVCQLWMLCQPFLKVLFRTEEVVDSSTTSQENPRGSRLKRLDTGIFENQVDSRAAVLTCIVDRDSLVFQFAADQQHIINRSINLKRFLSFHLNAMVHESDPHGPFPVLVPILRHAIAEDLDSRIGPHNSETS
jgi:hypothetical protein